MGKLSFLELFDALSQGNERFKTIKNLKFSSDIEECILAQNKYCIDFLADYNDVNVIVKILLDSDSERCVDIMDGLRRVVELDMAIFAPIHIFQDELVLINSNGSVSTIDVVIIEDSKVTLSDADLSGDVIPSFACVCVELLSHNIVLDFLSFDSFRYSEERGVYLSPSPYFVCHTSSSDLVAFKNYLIMQLLHLIVAVLEDERNAIDWDSEAITINENSNFDLRKRDYFLSNEYIDVINEAISIIESRSDIDAEEIRRAVITDKVSVAIHIFKSISSVYYSENIEECDYLNDKNFDITGEHCENRIAIRNNRIDKFGYLDFDGDLVIDFVYDEVSDFNEGIAVCRKGELYGAIDSDGAELSPFKYTCLEWDSIRNTFLWEIGEDKGQLKRREFIKI